jgi:hypothetical protein
VRRSHFIPLILIGAGDDTIDDISGNLSLHEASKMPPLYFLVPDDTVRFMNKNWLHDLIGVCVAGAAACAVFAVFVFLVFALSIFQFANYFGRGRL